MCFEDKTEILNLTQFQQMFQFCTPWGIEVLEVKHWLKTGQIYFILFFDLIFNFSHIFFFWFTLLFKNAFQIFRKTAGYQQGQ